MKTSAIKTLTFAACLLVSGSASAFNTLSFDGRNSLVWRSVDRPVEYEIEQGFPALSNGVDIIIDSHDSWVDVTCSSISFSYQGDTTGNQIFQRDGINKVVFTTAGFSTTNAGALGVTYTEFSADGNGWFISGGDIAINGYSEWSSSGQSDRFDLEGTVTHEVGHMIGIQHTPVAAAT
ncbi:MAG: hypothetical protein KC561_10535, partial [Myxococcales bacterium]|nr:hypothetical protein [Myxococcales bacterium]